VGQRWYVAPFAQFTFPTAHGCRQRRRLCLSVAGHQPGWDIELRCAYEKLPKDGAPEDWKNWTVEVDGKCISSPGRLARWDGCSPMPGGLGAINDDVGISKTSVMATAGLGVALPLARWGRFFIDGRYRWDANGGKLVSQNSFGDWLLTTGVVIPSARHRGWLSLPPPKHRPATCPASSSAPPPPPPPPPAPPPVTRTFDISADGLFAFDKAQLTPVGESRIENMIEVCGSRVTGLTEITIIGTRIRSARRSTT